MGDNPRKQTDGGLVQGRSSSERRPSAHEQPALERHVLPGAIRVGDYHEYNRASHWTATASPPTDDGESYWLARDEWLVYDVEVTEPGFYELTLDIAAADGFGGGDVGVMVNDKLRQRVELDSTGGWYDWETVTTHIELPRGLNTVRLVVFDGGWKLRRLAFR